MKSAAAHRATLLHYIGANGVEGYRQKTPKNAVKVAELDPAQERKLRADLRMKKTSREENPHWILRLRPSEEGQELRWL